MLRLLGVANEGEEKVTEAKGYILVDKPGPGGGFQADESHEGYANED